MSDLESNTSGMSQQEFEKIVADKRKIGDRVNLREVESIWNKRYKKNQPKSAMNKFIMKILNFGTTNPKQAPSQGSKVGSDTERKKQIEDKELNKATTTKQTKSKGGATTKNRIGGNDYRKGGYVLSTVDNRKKMSK